MIDALARSTATPDMNWVDETAPDTAPAVHWVTTARQRSDTSSSTLPEKGTAGGVDAGAPEFIQRVVARPVLARQLERFELLQQFEGTVLAVGPGEFQARLRDLTASHPPETATFDLDDVSDDDRDLVRPGAVFYWNLGYRILRTGQKERSAAVRFRRLPMWSRSDLGRVRECADRWATMFDDDDPR